MNLSEVLKSALTAVDEAAVPSDLRDTAFKFALESLSGQSRHAGPTGNAAITSTKPSEPAQHDAHSDRLASIASALDVSTDDAQRLFDEHEGELQYVGSVELLGTSKVAKVQALTVLLVFGRSRGGYDDGPTLDTVVRAEIERHGLLDTSNYTKNMPALKRWLNINGSGKSLNFKPKYEAAKEAREIASRVLKED